MSIQHANLGVVKKDLQLYYNREYIKSFRGEASTNYAGTVTANHESAVAYWVSTVTKDTSTGYTALKVVPLAGGYQYTAGVYASCGIIAGNGGFQPPGTYSLSAKVLLPKGSVFTFGFRAYPFTEEFAVDVTGTGTWQTIKRENFTCTGYNYLQFQMVRRVNGSTGGSSPIYPGDPFWVRDVMINSGSYAKPFASMTNELSARPENTTNITNNANFASAISGTDSGGTQNGWTFGSWSGTGNSYITQGSTVIYSSGNTTYSAIPLRVTRAAAGSMDFFSSNWNTLVNGTVYTISFWARSNITTTLNINHQNLGTIKSYSIDAAAGWYKYTGTFTHAGGTQYPYLTHAGANGTWIEIANVQLEAKSFPTDFTTTNRTSVANTAANGGGLLDISGNNINADLTNVVFDTNGYIFSGSQYITVPYSSNFDRNDFTISGYFRTSTNDNSHDTIVSRNSDVYGATNGWNISRLRNGLSLANCFRFMIYGDSSTAVEPQGPVISDNVWRHFAVVVDKSVSNTVTIYINGIAYSTPATLPSGNYYPSSGSPPLYIGCNKTNADLWNGDISQILYYQKALTAAEVLQNFNATRTTYGL
jgi:hypothetical protein